MKKKLIISSIVLLGILLGTYLYMNKKSAPLKVSIANHIPKTNGIVGAINFGAIKEIINDELFSNPLEMLSFQNNLGNQQFVGDLILSLIQGDIDTQQKMVFSMGKDTTDVRFLLLRINDAKQLQLNLKDKLSNYPSNKIALNNSSFGNYYLQQKLGIVLNEHFVLIASADEQEVNQLWTQVTEQKQCYEPGNTNISTLMDSPDHISVWILKDGLNTPYFSENNPLFSHVNFLQGKLEVSSEMVVSSIYFPNELNTTFACDTCALELSLNMQQLKTIPNMLSAEFNQQLDSVCGLLNINYPQLLAVCNGQLNAIVMGKGIQNETFVTYEFDDDFNKVRLEKVVSTPVVDYMFCLGSDEKELYNYFRKKGIIKKDNGIELFTNPVAKCYVNDNNELLLLASKPSYFAIPTQASLLSKGVVFKANLDYLMPLFLPKDSTYSGVVQSISCTGSQQDTLIQIKMEFNMRDASKNALFDVANTCFSF